MATKITESHTCDISGDTATYPNVTFSLDNVDYEIDLNEEYRERLTSVLADYIASARRTGGRRKMPVAVNGQHSAVTKTPSVEENKAKREWLRANGWTVADRGRIPGDADEAYTRAMTEKAAEDKKPAAGRRKRTAKTAA